MNCQGSPLIYKYQLLIDNKPSCGGTICSEAYEDIIKCNKNVQRLISEYISTIILTRAPDILYYIIKYIQDYKNSLIGKSPNSKLIKEYISNLGRLNNFQSQALIGIILGDGSIQTQNLGKTYRIKFEQGNKHKDYIDHLYDLYYDYIISPPHKKIRINKNNNEIINWGMQTVSSIHFNLYATLFKIKNRSKGISDNLINDYLTEVGLAYWFMDDGGKLDYNKGSKNKSIVLNTQNFLYSEVISMSKDIN